MRVGEGQRLRRRIAGGVAVKLLGTLPSRVMQLLLTLLCVRWLLPEVYGAYSLAISLFGFSDLLTNPGVQTYLIQVKRLEDKTVDTAWTFSVIRGLVTAAVLFACAPALAALFDGVGAVVPLLRGLSISFIFIGLRNPHTARFHRQLRFGWALVSETSGGLIGTLAAVVSLYFFRDPRVLVGGVALGHALNALISWLLAPRRPRARLDVGELRCMWRFTRHLLANALIIYALLNLDDLLVAHVAGTAALGLYAMGYRLVNASVRFVTGPLGGLVLPVLSRVVDDRQAFARGSRVAVGAFSAVSWGLTATLAVCAHDLFEVLNGAPAWSETSAIILTLLPFVLVRGINGALSAIVLAQGKPHLLNWISGLQLVLMPPVGYLALVLGGVRALGPALFVLSALAMGWLIALIPHVCDARRRELFALVAAPALPAALSAGVGLVIASSIPSVWARLALVPAMSCGLFIAQWELITRTELLARIDAHSLSSLRTRRSAHTG